MSLIIKLLLLFKNKILKYFYFNLIKKISSLKIILLEINFNDRK